MKPVPEDPQGLLLESYRALGIDPLAHDIRFVEDDWESPTLGAWGLGWEVWCDGMEVTQFTYFQQVGGIDCAVPSVEFTYGLERLAMYVQGVESIFELDFNGAGVSYGDVFRRAEREMSVYSFERADTALLARHFADAEAECGALLAARLRASGLRPVHQGEPPLQPARCAGRDQRRRAGGDDRAGAGAGEGKLRGLARGRDRLSHARTAARAPERGDPGAHAGPRGGGSFPTFGRGTGAARARGRADVLRAAADRAGGRGGGRPARPARARAGTARRRARGGAGRVPAQARRGARAS